MHKRKGTDPNYSPERAEKLAGLYCFGWPSFLGGADTKLTHLILLLHEHCEITVVPNDDRHLLKGTWSKFLDQHGVRYCLLDQLPSKIVGFGLALSNECFFRDRIAHRAKERGLRIIWSSEMMWHHQGELDAVREGIIDRVLTYQFAWPPRVRKGAFHQCENKAGHAAFS